MSNSAATKIYVDESIEGHLFNLNFKLKLARLNHEAQMFSLIWLLECFKYNVKTNITFSAVNTNGGRSGERNVIDDNTHVLG